MDNAIESMNAIDFKAFRKSLREVVIIGWYFPGKEGPNVGKSFDKPHEDMVHETPFDDKPILNLFFYPCPNSKLSFDE